MPYQILRVDVVRKAVGQWIPVRARFRLVRKAVRLEQMINGVDAKAGHTLAQPEPQHLAHLLHHGRVAKVQIRLLGGKLMQIVLTAVRMQRPGGTVEYRLLEWLG